MPQVRFSDYLLNGYGTIGDPETFVKNGKQYTIQRYRGKHKNEFTLRSENGDVYLYENNVLLQEWKEDKDGEKLDEFVRYKNGRADFSQRFEYIEEQENSKRIVYHKKGLRMEIWSAQTDRLLYHGEYNERRMKEGWGIEYDEKCRNMALEGIWSKGRLIEVIRCFNGDTMTELKRNGSDSLDPTKRIPIYVGGYRYDEDNETFVREGKGCLIDEESGLATRECEWKDGKEVSGRDLHGGWYDPKWKYVLSTAMIPRPEPAPLRINVTESAEWSDVSLQVSDLTISSKCCNDLKALDLNRFQCLRSIEIGDYCFGSVQTFQIDGLNQLKTIKIGMNSFTQLKQEEWDKMMLPEALAICKQSKSFHILNCESLESIEIDQYSFSDFAGEFELKNLPQLQSIQIGTVRTIRTMGIMGIIEAIAAIAATANNSYNFYSSSFVIRGIDVILNIVMIRSSKSTIHYIGK